VNSNGFARIATVAVGAAGVVGAHTLAYRLAHASSASHDHALESAGHGYWDLAVLLGLAALVIGVGVEMVFGPRRAEPRRTPVATWVRLFALQGLTFAALETLERALQGPEQLTRLLQEPAFWLAFPLLVLTAALGCVLLLVARKAGETLARHRRFRPARSATLRIRAHSVQAISHVLVSITRERAPPRSLVC